MNSLNFLTFFLCAISITGASYIVLAVSNGHYFGLFLLLFWYWTTYVPITVAQLLFPATDFVLIRRLLGFVGAALLTIFVLSTHSYWFDGLFGVVIMFMMCGGTFSIVADYDFKS